MTDLTDALETRLRAVGTTERAEGEKRYLKSDLVFLGATMADIRSAVREAAPRLDHGELIAEVVSLWSAPVFERRMAAVLLLARGAHHIETGDLGLLERLVRESRTWALVDPIAIDVVGPLLERDTARVAPVLDRWAGEPDFWVRRASLLAELRPIKAGQPLDRFLGRAEPMLPEREFFIRKAIGWVLRDAGRRRPSEVAAWLAPRTHRASGVTMREAVKYLPTDEATTLMDAYRARQPAA